jgi:uncharacterized RDD family membrane protein YckC
MADETPQGPAGDAPSPWQVPATPPPGGPIPSAPPPPPYGGYAGVGAPPPYGAPPPGTFDAMYTPYAAGGPGMSPVGPGGLPLANYGLRLAGWLIDLVVVWVVLLVILLPLHAFHRVHEATNQHMMAFHTNATGLLVPAAVVILYGMFLCGSARGQTLGMMIVRVKVVDANGGGPIGMGRALGRAAFEYVMAAVLFVPWVVDMLFPLWDQRRQTLHDKVTNAVVVRV